MSDIKHVKKYIFITSTFFTSHQYEQFGVDVFKERNLKVEIWDITRINYKFSAEQLGLHQLKGDNILIFQSKKSFSYALQNQGEGVFFILICTLTIRTFWLFRRLSRYKFRYALYALNFHPIGSKELNSKNKQFIGRLFQITPHKLLNFIFKKLPSWALLVKPADYELASGLKTVGFMRPVSMKTKKVWMHAPDYDRFLDIRQNHVRLIKKPYVVFLDENYPYHPDYKYMNESSPVTPSRYYQLLNNFFDVIKAKFMVDVVIAAHPKFNYEDHPGVYKENQVVNGKTGELVQYADFVIAHSSTSINFAILFEKPVIMISTDEIDNSKWIDGIRNMSFYLNSAVINIDQHASLEKNIMPQISQEARITYKSHYITAVNGSGVYLRSWDIFIDTMSGA